MAGLTEISQGLVVVYSKTGSGAMRGECSVCGRYTPSWWRERKNIDRWFSRHKCVGIRRYGDSR